MLKFNSGAAKKLICVFSLMLLLILSLVSCGENSEPWDTALLLEENGYNVSLTVGEKSIKALSAEFGDFFNKDVYCVSFAVNEDSDLNDYEVSDFGLFIYCNNKEEVNRIFKKMEKAFLLDVDVVEQVDGVVFVGSMDIWDTTYGKK